MKAKVLIILLMFLFSGCGTFEEMRAINRQQKMNQTAWLSLLEIKEQYGLTHRECKAVRKAAYNGEINCRYNMRRDCAEYDASVDYSKFKIYE
jgi:uncharacterized protein YcfL